MSTIHAETGVTEQSRADEAREVHTSHTVVTFLSTQDEGALKGSTAASPQGARDLTRAGFSVSTSLQTTLHRRGGVKILHMRKK